MERLRAAIEQARKTRVESGTVQSASPENSAVAEPTNGNGHVQTNGNVPALQSENSIHVAPSDPAVRARWEALELSIKSV